MTDSANSDAASRAGDPLKAYFSALPKVELHLHLEGAIRPEMMLMLAERNRLRLAFNHADQWPDYLNFRQFDDFARALLTGVRCLQHPQDHYDVLVDIGQNLAAQNVRYAEITWTPQFYLTRSHPLQAFFDALNQARRRVQTLHGVEIRWIPDLVRSYPKPSWAITNWLALPEIRSQGIVALGLGGPEAQHPASAFEAQFAHARANGLPANPHAGEHGGPDSLWDTLQHLQPKRIGHGVRAIEDQTLVEHLAHNKIPLEVCLTSNVKLWVFRSYAEHPVKRLIDAGCVVTLNTDDPVLFQTTLTDEYVHAVRQCGLSIRDVQNSIINAVASTYLPLADREAMQAAFVADFESLAASATGLEDY